MTLHSTSKLHSNTIRRKVKLKKHVDAQQLFQALKDRDPDARCAAAEALGEIGRPAVKPLIEALRDEDGAVRTAAAWSLGDIKDATSVEPLIQALKDKDQTVRSTAAWSLGDIKTTLAIEPLIQALRDKDQTVRSTAAWSLGNIRDEKAVKSLIQAVSDEDHGVRSAAAGALGKIKNYDVYVIPGGSCAEKILRSKNYKGVVGIACGSELKMALELLKKLEIHGQGVILTKNGCANTKLDLESLEKIL